MSISRPLNRQPLLLPHRKRAGVRPVPGPGGRLVLLCRHQSRSHGCPCPGGRGQAGHDARRRRTRPGTPV